MRKSDFEMSGEIIIKNPAAGMEYVFVDKGNNCLLVKCVYYGSNKKEDVVEEMKISIPDIPDFVKALEQAGEINRKW